MTWGTAKRTTEAGGKSAEGASSRPTAPETVLAEADAIKSTYVGSTAAYEPHRHLFELFRSVEADIEAAPSDVRGLQHRAALVAAQSEILDIAASLPASSLADCTYKLALWRADYCRHRDEAWPRGDIVAASLLEDMAALCGEPRALPGEDEDEDDV